MSSYQHLLNEYKKKFDEIGEFETLRVFLFELCNEKNINLYLEKDNEVDEEVFLKFNEGVKLLLEKKPLAQVLGYSYFYGYKLKINDDVLIPRYETEELVMQILIEIDNFFKGEKITAADIGTGSGAIAISIMKETNNIDMLATDISKNALLLAKENAHLQKVDIEFLEGDMLKPLIEKQVKLDLLISNPPYIPKDEIMDISVKKYEPSVALFGGDDGLSYYREIFENCQKILNKKFMMAFEIGYNQKEEIKKLAEKYFKNIDFKCFKDINKKDRIVIIKGKI